MTGLNLCKKPEIKADINRIDPGHPITVSINDPEAGVVIRYSTDGTFPDNNSKYIPVLSR